MNMALDQRQAQIEKITGFIQNHNECMASQAVCRRILGREFYEINDEIISDLVNALEQADDLEVSACYTIIS